MEKFLGSIIASEREPCRTEQKITPEGDFSSSTIHMKSTLLSPSPLRLQDAHLAAAIAVSMFRKRRPFAFSTPAGDRHGGKDGTLNA
jgi:hypothetical protein